MGCNPVRVAVVGSSGQLGDRLVTVLNDAKHDVIPLQHADIECGDPESVRMVLEPLEPEVVVNCAALTDVDRCQDDPEEAFRVNALGSLYVAQVCARVGSLCVYVSTDFVFDGQKGVPYTEDDCPHPINVYGSSKHAGEMLLRQACPRWLIVRMASLFGAVGVTRTGGNFVDTILEKSRERESLRVVNDIYMSPTYTADASKVLEQLLRRGMRGIFHLTNAGRCSWYEFARTALEIAGRPSSLEPIRSQDYRYRARRPQDSSLSSQQCGRAELEVLRPWQAALEAYLVEWNCQSPRHQ